MATNNGAAVASAHLGRKTASRRRKRDGSRRATQRGLGARARHVTQESWNELRDSASEFAEDGQTKIHVLERALKSFIREQPLKSALICTSLALAAGAGVLVGRMWLRRESQPVTHHSLWQ